MMIHHRNNIGLLRLVLASLVIVGHAPEQIDGDRHREPLTMLFHSVSLGELSVDGFFLISGYLISKSMMSGLSYPRYLERRVMRIWPGYLVACLLCTLALAPLVGGHPFSRGVLPFLRMIFLLDGPVDTAGQLAGLPRPVLNGAMWTIPLEFLCYLMVAGLALSRLLRNTAAIAVLAFCALTIATVGSFDNIQRMEAHLPHQGVVFFALGDPMRLAGFFLVGTLGFLCHAQLIQRMTGLAASVAGALAVASLLSPHTAQFGLALGGGAALFWLALKADLGRLQNVNDKWDISYGTYLYGWPIAISLLYFSRSLTPLALICFALPLAWLAGAASWWLIERVTKDIFGSRPEVVTV